LTTNRDESQIHCHAADCRLVTTTFAHKKNPTPINVRDWTWGEFVEFIEHNGHMRTPGRSREDKDAVPLFSNVKLKDGTKSSNANVEAVFCWTLDLDKLGDAEVEKVVERLAADGLAFLMYSTHSHTATKSKYRVLGPLLEPVAGKDWPGVWRAIIDRYAPGGDEQCKDVRRLYYWPSCPEGVEPVLFSEPGEPLDVVTLDVKPARPTAPVVDLDAREIVDGGFKVQRCPIDRAPAEHGAELCRTMPPAVEGQGGSIALLRVARALAWGLELARERAIDLISTHYNARCSPPWSEAEVAHKVDDASGEAGAPYHKGSLLPPEPDSFDHLPLIVQNNGRYWLRERDSDDYKWRVTVSDIVRKVKDLYDPNELATWNNSENPQVGKATIENKSRVVDQIVTCYHQPRTTFDVETNTLVEGLRIDPKLTPRENAHVARWLAALAGDDLLALKMWIAGCRQDLLSAPSPALGLVGPKEAGKSLIAAGLARLYGNPCAPVRATVLVSKFNSDLCRCPIVLADEKLPNDLTGEDFRDAVAQRMHSIEPKGKERHTLNGSIRFVVAANNVDRVLGLTGEKCDDDLRAIADRWLLLQVTPERATACTAALEPLKQSDGSNVDLAAIAGHFLWLQANVEPHRGRFVGSPPDSKILSALRRSEADRSSPELFDLIADYLTTGVPTKGQFGDPPKPQQGVPKPDASQFFPVFRDVDGRLFARPAVLAALLGDTAKAVSAALRPFMVGDRRLAKTAAGNVLAYELDVERLSQVRETAKAG
jgi:hypothetical protein